VNVKKRNKTAVRHGWQGEKEAYAWLLSLTSAENIRVINTLFDFTCLDTFVEVKTCQEWLTDTETGNQRTGRFTLNAKQHTKLLDARGYYLFIVLKQTYPPSIFLVSAEKMPLHKQIAWTTALKYAEQFPADALEEKK